MGKVGEGRARGGVAELVSSVFHYEQFGAVGEKVGSVDWRTSRVRRTMGLLSRAAYGFEG